MYKTRHNLLKVGTGGLFDFKLKAVHTCQCVLWCLVSSTRHERIFKVQ